MTRIARWLPRAFYDSAIIVVSILLALAVNEWRDHRERMSRAGDARHLFVNEIRANRDSLVSDFYLAHHKKLQMDYKKLVDDRIAEQGPILDSGVHPAQLRDAAWRSFSNGNIMLDFASSDVLLLADVYRAQEELEKLNSTFLLNIEMPHADRESPAFMRDENRSIFLYLTDVVPAEEGLVRLYERALAQLK